VDVATAESVDTYTHERLATGIEGLDLVLDGGFPVARMHLVYGRPGVGKTTLALQFLIEGAEAGEEVVYVALSETADEIRDIARSHGWTLPHKLHLCDFHTREIQPEERGGYTLFHPSEIELSDTARQILDLFEKVRPTRVVFDSLSEMRLMARDSLRYRRQILALKQYFIEHNTTVLLLDTRLANEVSEFQLETLTHGVMMLEQVAQDYGDARRRLRVEKMRGVKFVEGFHDFRIRRGGVVVYPRLPAYPSAAEGAGDARPVKTIAPQLDDMTGGPLDRGTTTMLIGPAGVGKSTLASTYVLGALAQGERCSVFLFDEEPRKWLHRARWLDSNLDLEGVVASGQLQLRHINPAELSPGEFAFDVRQAEAQGAGVLVIDSFNGYRNAMPEERFLTLHLHELFSFLNQRGVVTLVVAAQHGFVGEALDEPFKLSYLADSVIVLRYFEAFGRVRKAISMIKRRTGPHEQFIRELDLGPHGVRFGKPLVDFQGILAGELSYTGDRERLIHGDGEGNGEARP
jgi:circadian clock protein KaiC